MAAAVPIAALAVSAIGTGYAIHQGEQQREKLKDAQKKEKAQRNTLLAQTEERQKVEDLGEAARRAREKQRQRAIAAGGRQSTILTSLDDRQEYAGAGGRATILGG